MWSGPHLPHHPIILNSCGMRDYFDVMSLPIGLWGPEGLFIVKSEPCVDVGPWAILEGKSDLAIGQCSPLFDVPSNLVGCYYHLEEFCVEVTKF